MSQTARSTISRSTNRSTNHSTNQPTNRSTSRSLQSPSLHPSPHRVASPPRLSPTAASHARLPAATLAAPHSPSKRSAAPQTAGRKKSRLSAPPTALSKPLRPSLDASAILDDAIDTEDDVEADTEDSTDVDCAASQLLGQVKSLLSTPRLPRRANGSAASSPGSALSDSDSDDPGLLAVQQALAGERVASA